MEALKNPRLFNICHPLTTQYICECQQT